MTVDKITIDYICSKVIYSVIGGYSYVSDLLVSYPDLSNSALPLIYKYPQECHCSFLYATFVKAATELALNLDDK